MISLSTGAAIVMIPALMVMGKFMWDVAKYWYKIRRRDNDT